MFVIWRVQIEDQRAAVGKMEDGNSVLAKLRDWGLVLKMAVGGHVRLLFLFFPQLSAFLNFLEFSLQRGEFVVGEILEIDQRIARLGGAADQFIEFQVESLGVAVLSVLDEKYHEEGNDRRRGIDHELPSVREMKERASNAPDND
jgi:hypothetical protein